MENKKEVVINGTPPLFFLFLVFLVLKLLGYISWSWWWVTAPLWAPVAFFATILALVAVVWFILAIVLLFKK